MNKLHLGCGKEYKKGFINIDFNKNRKTDMCFDIRKKFPFEDNSIDYVYSSHVLEHLTKDEFFKTMKEIWRVCKNGTILDLEMPHFTSVFATQLPDHKSFFGTKTFEIFEKGNKVKGGYTDINLKVIDKKLHFALKKYDNFKWASIFRFFDWIFNFGPNWQLFMERFWCFKVRYGSEKSESPWAIGGAFNQCEWWKESCRVATSCNTRFFLLGLKVRWLVSIISLLLYRRH